MNIQEVYVDPLWNEIETNYGYELICKLGEGSYGEVFKVRHIETGEKFAIKLIKDPFDNVKHATQLYREMVIMRKLSKFHNNIFTTQIVDIILPGYTYIESESASKVTTRQTTPAHKKESEEQQK